MKQYVNQKAAEFAGSQQNIKSRADALTADFGGTTLGEHEAVKAKERARLVALRANRPKQLQQFNEQFGSPIKAQVSRTIEKRKAGQSAIMERNNLIRSISDVGKALVIGSPGSTIKAKTNTRNQRIASLRLLQQKLTNLLARYRF